MKYWDLVCTEEYTVLDDGLETLQKGPIDGRFRSRSPDFRPFYQHYGKQNEHMERGGA
jgi:hypothetical protein